SRRSVVEVELLSLKSRAEVLPNGDHLLVVEADEILGAGHQARAHAVVVVGELVVPIFGGEAQRADEEFRRSHEVRCAGNHVRILAGDPERHEPAHGKSGGGAMLAVGDGAVVGIDVIDQFGEVEGELAVRFHRTDIIRTRILLARRARVIPVPLHDDDVVAADVGRNSIAAIVGAGGVVAIYGVVDRLIVAFAPAVKPVDDRIALAGGGVVGRKEDAVIPGFTEDLAVVGTILNQGLGSRSRGGTQEKEKRREEHQYYGSAKSRSGACAIPNHRTNRNTVPVMPKPRCFVTSAIAGTEL